MAERFEVKAVARHIQMTPRKVRRVVDAVRGKDAREALDILRFMPHRAAEPVYKVIRSAVATPKKTMGWILTNSLSVAFMRTKARVIVWHPTAVVSPDGVVSGR